MHKQLLTLAGMKEQVEDILWAHLQAEIAPQVIKYQVQRDADLTKPSEQPFTPQQFAQVLCTATEGKDTSEVCGSFLNLQYL